MSLTNNNLLASLPSPLREELFDEFNKILKNYRESRWEPAELEGGKLCEIVYTILEGHIAGIYSAKAYKPGNFPDSCKAFEKADPTKFSRAIRVQVPRILIALYEIRNNRGVGHVGGDVSPNHMDAAYVVNSAKWIVAELIRIFHNVSTDIASASIDLIIQRETPLVWNIGTKKRVLKKDLNYSEQTLLILHSCIDGSASVDNLFSWVEYSTLSKFKINVLKKLHDDRLIEYTLSSDVAKISPLGIELVEAKILKSLN